MGGGGGVWLGGGGGQGGCELRSEAFVKIQKKFFRGEGGGGGGVGSGSLCENSKKKNWGGGFRVGGVRVDVNGEVVKLL